MHRLWIGRCGDYTTSLRWRRSKQELRQSSSKKSTYLPWCKRACSIIQVIESTDQLPVIYTAGYGNRGFPAFIELMARFGITHLVDVRSVPQSSYWEDFRRENLMALVPPTGLKYVYMGDTLGGVENSPALCREPET
ncbi:MAG TPA: DUF488 family protein, partial [Fimbriimonas sp.]|nr:DUF488 family protein [Fimbriimonas sp.]